LEFSRVIFRSDAQSFVVEAKAPIKPPPRPFKLNDEQRKLAEEIGYKVVDRYTEEDFGQNKRPKAFAVVQIGSHQFKVSPNDLIYTEKLKYCDINDKLMLNKVLMLGSKDQTIIGRPVLPKAAVFAVVEEHALDEKVIIFKKKRRKNYRRTTGHRQVSYR
jgi:large subunit ribosomal protein L21